MKSADTEDEMNAHSALPSQLSVLAVTLALLAGAIGCSDDGPDIPHAISTESAESCKACHDNGIDNAPARHGESSGCTDCHAPTKRVAAPDVPHEVQDTAEESCLACHGAGDQGASVTPHPGWPLCLECHKEGP